jgi:hypothetical protein
MSRAESDAILAKFLDFLQRDWRIRLGIGVMLVGALLYLAGRSAWGLAVGRARAGHERAIALITRAS